MDNKESYSQETSQSLDVKEESPRKHQQHGGGDRLKRDEWSEGAVSSLLEAYESKWVLRNRAKLKGQDWEDVARYVSSRANSARTPKTQTQCKNKIESMKKRYRSESAVAAAASSSWPLYHRLHHLLRGNNGGGSGASTVSVAEPINMSSRQVVQQSQHLHQRHHPAPAPAPPPPPPPPPPLLLLEPSPAVHALLPRQPAAQLQVAPPMTPTTAVTVSAMIVGAPPPPDAGTGTAAQNSLGSDGVGRVGGKEEENRVQAAAGKLSPGTFSDKNTNAVPDAAAVADTDSSTPALVYSEKENNIKKFGSNSKRAKKMKRKAGAGSGGGGGERRRSPSEYWEIAESIRWMAEVVVRSEQARMETMREVEKMRIEADAKRGEIELKRTEILASTQLEIAKLFAAGLTKGRSAVDSSLRIGRN